MNIIPVIAEKYGKEIGEIFKIQLKTGSICVAKFTTDKGLLYQDRFGWFRARLVLADLLTGDAEIIEEDDKHERDL